VTGVALAVGDFSGAVMTASTNDDNSTKELKGFVSHLIYFSISDQHLLSLCIVDML